MSFAWRCEYCKGAPLPGKAYEKPWVGPCPFCGRICDGERVSVYDEDVGGAEIQPICDGEVIALDDAIAGQERDPDAQLIKTGSPGWDWVLCGGIPPSIAILLSSPPGGGKSTALIELFRKLALLKYDCLYVCSEESTKQLGRRYGRLGKFPPNLGVVNQTDFEEIKELIEERRPKFFAIDSLHDLENVEDDNGFKFSIGSHTSVTLAAKQARKLASDLDLTAFLVAHQTKDGAIAGANTVQHAVDARLKINGRRKLIDGDEVIVGAERTLRLDGKYRFGETGRQAYFRHDQSGLHDMGPWTRERPPWDIPTTSNVVPLPTKEDR